MVTMTHPNLPDREIEVHEQTVEIHQASGWVLKPERSASPPSTPSRGRDAD